MSAAGAKVKERPTLPAVAAKLLPGDVRAAWQRRFLSFAWDDLNALFDRLAAAASEGTLVPPDIPARIQSIVRALSWSREAVIGHLWSLIEDGIAQPEDAFAPALIFRGLVPDDEKAQRWLAALRPDVSAAIEYVQRDSPSPSVSAASRR